jgi:multiple sugar transport system substrate-binding protein
MRAWKSVAVAALVIAPVAGCGSGSSRASSGNTVNWYIGQEGWLPSVIKDCNAKANGAFTLKAQSLPTNPDAQREQLVRRLAAKDASIDLIGMDVIWTAEFGKAGWVSSFKTGDLANVGDASQVLKGPFLSAQFDGKQYGAPLNSNTRLLWYRKSILGDRPVPQTWDQLLTTADQLHTKIQETGKRAESLMVFFNALQESAGGHIVKATPDGGTEVDLPKGPTVKALSIMERYAKSQAAPTALSNSAEDDNRLAFQKQSSGSAFMINWPFVYPSVLAADKKLASDYGYAPYPRVDEGTPARPPLGGYNLGISAYSKHHAAALAAINCLTETAQQRTIATTGGQPSVLRALGNDPEILKALPFLPLMVTQLENAAPRPVTPNYNDLSLAVRQELHPMSSIGDVDKKYTALRDLLKRALASEAVL